MGDKIAVTVIATGFETMNNFTNISDYQAKFNEDDDDDDDAYLGYSSPASDAPP